jgi:hypothetical protein
MTRQDARRMIVRRALKAGIITRLGCHRNDQVTVDQVERIVL